MFAVFNLELKLKLVNKIIGLSQIDKKADNTKLIIDSIKVGNRASCEQLLESQILLKLSQITNNIHESLGISDTSPEALQIENINKKYSIKLARSIACYLISNEHISPVKIENDLDLILKSYKEEIQNKYKKLLASSFQSVTNIRIQRNINYYLLSNKYKNLLKYIHQKKDQVLNSLLSRKEMDDFAATLMWTGSLTNAMILTVLHYRRLPYITIVKNILLAIYGPLLEHYYQAFKTIDKLKENNNYTFEKKLILSGQLLIPAILMVASFVVLAPMFNDFLLALIIPACMSICLKVVQYGIDFYNEYKNSQATKDIVTKRLINTFGNELAYKVADFYRKKILGVKLKINQLEIKKELTLSESEKSLLAKYKEELKELQLEWKLLSTYNSCSSDVTTEQAREIYYARLAQSASRKCTRQQKVVAKEQQQILDNIDQFIEKGFLSNSVEDNLVKVPLVFKKLSDEQQRRQERVDDIACQVSSRFMV